MRARGTNDGAQDSSKILGGDLLSVEALSADHVTWRRFDSNCSHCWNTEVSFPGANEPGTSGTGASLRELSGEVESHDDHDRASGGDVRVEDGRSATERLHEGERRRLL